MPLSDYYKSPVCLPEGSRRQAARFPENLCEIGAVEEATVGGDFRDAFVRMDQELAGVFYADLGQVFYGGLVEILIEDPDAVPGADEGAARNILQADLFGVVNINILHHSPDALLTAG